MDVSGEDDVIYVPRPRSLIRMFLGVLRLHAQRGAAIAAPRSPR